MIHTDGSSPCFLTEFSEEVHAASEACQVLTIKEAAHISEGMHPESKFAPTPCHVTTTYGHRTAQEDAAQNQGLRGFLQMLSPALPFDY
jgi:hypothetical protein